VSARPPLLAWLLVAALGLTLASPLEAARFKRPATSPSADSLRVPASPPAETMDREPGDGPAAGPRPAGLFLRSLAVPGWGQAVLARSRPELKGKGKTGFWLDVGLATGAWALLRHSRIKQAEYQSYAMRVAGARRHGDGSDYWVAVSNHLSREAYNQAMLESNGWNQRYLDPADDWAWPGTAEQNRYRDLRAVSEKALSQSLAVGGALFINHVLSAAQTLRLVRQAEPGGPALTALPVPGGVGLALSLDLSTPRP
jgi:hypothetical protein